MTTNNPIVDFFLSNGDMEYNAGEIDPSFELSEIIHKALESEKVKATYHFSATTGKLVITKCLGRDANGDFFNEANGNIDGRRMQIKTIIVDVLVNRYNSFIK